MVPRPQVVTSAGDHRIATRAKIGEHAVGAKRNPAHGQRKALAPAKGDDAGEALWCGATHLTGWHPIPRRS